MDGPYVAKVAFRPQRNCFICVPQQWLSNSSTDTRTTVFEVQYGTRQKAYFSCSGETTGSIATGTGDQWVVEINGFYALKLGMYEGEQVVICRRFDNTTTIESLNAEPLAIDDWEILELHSDYVQNNLMNQVRLVWNGQLLPIWVTQSVCIFVKISGLQPRCEVGLLEQLTDVHVAPKARNIDEIQKGNGTDEVQEHSKEITNKDSQNLKSRAEMRRGADDGEPVVNGDGSRWALSERLRKAFGGWFDPSDVKSGVDVRNDGRRDARVHLGKLRHDGLILRVHPWNRDDSLDAWSAVDEKLRDSLQKTTLWPLLSQPTTVVVSSQSFCRDFDFLNERNPVVVGKLKRILSVFDSSDKIGKQKAADDGQAKSKGNDSIGHHASPLSSLQQSYAHSLPSREYFVKVVIWDFLWEYIKDSAPELGSFVLGLTKCLVPEAILMQDSLRQQAGCEITSKVQLSFWEKDVVQPATITFLPFQNLAEEFCKDELEREIRIWLKRNATASCPVVATDGDVFEIHSSTGKTLSFVVHSPKTQRSEAREEASPIAFGPMTDVDLRREFVDRAHRLTEVTVVGPIGATLGGVRDLLRRGVDSLRLRLGLGPLSRALWTSTAPISSGSGLLVCGGRGSGKTTLARAMTSEVGAAPFFAFVTVVSCKTLKGKRVESVARLWKRTYREAIYRSPSVVVLDDLDDLAGSAKGPENEIGATAQYQARLAEVLSEILKEASTSDGTKVATIATCKSVATLHPTLASPQGIHFFPEVLTIATPNAERREETLKCLVASKSAIAAVDWRSLAARTEGFVAGDLEAVVDRAVHAASARSPDRRPEDEWTLRDEDWDRALADFQPASVRGLRLHVAGSKGWSDVGGLSRVKRVLMETLQWPTKYPQLFERCPIAPRSGILLYGPPGTGKTLLAEVVAKECGMRFIGIKGPELLSKYIGASEQSVRDLFERASDARPCILFFDEFDSLAPRRGHDSTGVTDRVVNQLLVQMDGVEGRRGVYVLAATSRPDLVDPALLRPGRLDKSLYCPLPSADERKEILRSLCSAVPVSEDVDLDAIADACVDYSGADLRGVLGDARRHAIHRTCDAVGRSTPSVPGDSEEFEHVDATSDQERSDVEWTIVHLPTLEDGAILVDDRTPEAVRRQIDAIASSLYGWPAVLDDESENATGKLPAVVTVEDFAAALRDSKPSLNAARRRQYEAIYEAFTQSEKGSGPGERLPSVAARATLA